MLLWLAFARTAPDRVVLVILDTVRSDRLSACGYEEPTSTVLSSLDGALACDAYAPGSWTLPSHASFFTGLWPDQHRAHSITSGIDDLSGGGNRARPLDDSYPTLAEQMKARGYTTALFSANPVVGGTMGLGRGFDHVQSASHFGEFHGKKFEPGFQGFLDELPDGPLFAVVNIADAHHPWTSTWHPEFSHVTGQPDYDKTDPGSDWNRFVRGAHEQSETLLRLISASYNEAVWRADQNLGIALAALNCPAEDCRLVITSDHGEFLGEHELLDHGHYVYDENQRVPLWTNVVDELPGPVSAIEAYWLLLDGRLANAPAQAMAWPHSRRCARTGGLAFCASSAALWTRSGKQMWMDGAYYSDDNGSALTRSTAGILDLSARVKNDLGDGDVPPQVMELLRAAGYVD